MKSAHIAALLLVLGLALMLPAHGAAQLGLGSLVVTMTAPANGSTVAGTVPVSASVTIVGALTVRGVQFKLDGADLGAEDTTAPYSIAWNTKTVSNGTHKLTAVARDLLGLAFTSNEITVTVFNDTTAPTIAMTSPAAGATLSGTTTIGANASDDVGVAGVQFRLDGVNFGAEDTTGPYAIAWDTTTATNGSHTITAVARDAAGNVSTSAAITITVSNDSTPPSVAISAPAAGAALRGTATVSANASDNVGVAGVQFRLDGANLGPEDTTAPYSVPWNTATAATGSHTLTAVARDAAGNLTTSSAVAVTVDNSAPAVAVTAPASGATLSGTVTVSATATDNAAIAGVQFRLNGANLGTEDTTAPYSIPWNTTTAANGPHSLTALARDAAGNTALSEAITVTVDNAAPSVAITSPSTGATVSATVTVSASASDGGGVAGVQFKLDGANLGAEDTTAPYSVSWDTTAVADGSHTLTAVARDNSGATATSAAVTVTVSNVTETVTRVQDTSASIAYAGAWALGNTAKAWSGGTAALATGGPAATGEPTRATLTFTGTAVRWIGFTGPQTGIARVYLDGALVATVDTYAATETVEAVLYTVTALASTTHTLAIESTGTKNASSSDVFVVVDAFDVTSAGGGSDTIPPSVAITTPAGGSTASGTIIVAASASDSGGVAGVQFLLDGAPLPAEDTTAPYSINWDTRTTADGSHTLTAVARDTAGNTATSAAVAVTVSNGGPPPSTASTFTRFENTDRGIAYAPGASAPGRPAAWWHGSRSRGWSAQTSSFNRSAGAQATFQFTGTDVKWIGFRAPWAGIARVHVDGVFATEVDLYSATEQAQAVVFSAAGLSAGTHTLTVESTGRKHGGDACDPAAPPCASDWAVVVDAFDVAPALPVSVTGTRVEDTDPAVQFTAAWGAAANDGSKAWSGGGARATTVQGEPVTFTFVGTSVSWIGLRGPGTGTAQIHLDGAVQATVNTSAPLDTQAVIYKATNLAPGRHELKIALGPGGGSLVVDAFDVGSRFEDGHSAIAYSGSWTRENQDRAWSGESANTGGGTAAFSATAGSSVTFTFTGTEVKWIGLRGPLAGIAEVVVDGGPASRLDLYAPTEELRATVFERTGLADAPHTVTIRVTGERNVNAVNALVVVDAFDVKLPATVPAISRVQETHASVTYTAEWVQSDGLSFRSGGGIKAADRVGARADFTFAGTGVTWVGRRFTDTGVARVYLDGALVGTVDTRSEVQEEFQAAVFTRTGLASGTHTLTIEVIGRNSEPAGATVASVWIDAFDIFK